MQAKCKCGWEGDGEQLLGRFVGTSDKDCPRCGAVFVAWPQTSFQTAFVAPMPMYVEWSNVGDFTNWNPSPDTDWFEAE
jgi:hypothetical protein